ncbi:MAG: hypothetical protein GY888_32445, partial [Planctomycetaceae bacterium]|nr:hypothetical protein [Planctomycetaceae bacterium]
TAQSPVETVLIVPLFKDVAIELGFGFVLLTWFVITGSSNAVNLTDGLDGLAILPSVLVAGGLGVFAYLTGHALFSGYLGIPFVAVGMLYRQGYFTQTIDEHGNQVAHYTTTDFDKLPLQLMRDEHGEELRVQVDFPGRPVQLKIWKARAGHISLYLLDSDLPENDEADRAIT